MFKLSIPHINWRFVLLFHNLKDKQFGSFQFVTCYVLKNIKGVVHMDIRVRFNQTSFTCRLEMV